MKKLFITAIKKNEPLAVKVLDSDSDGYLCENEAGEKISLFDFPELSKTLNKICDGDDVDEVKPIIEINFDGKVYSIYQLDSWADASKKV